MNEYYKQWANNPQLQKNEYQCAMCGNIYKKGWSDEESEAEAKEIFGKHPNDWSDKKSIICDDCFKKIDPREHLKELEEAKKFL